MDVSRREIVRAAGMTAAAVGLSGLACGSDEQASGTPETSSTATEDSSCRHEVEITKCGQYVVVQARNECRVPDSPGGWRRAFRGRVEARWNDSLMFVNRTDRQIKLYFPEPGIFAETLDGPEVFLEPSNDEKLNSRTLTLRATTENAEGGVYEYAVAYDKSVLDGKDPADGARWGLAIGGSSPIIDIRI